MPLILCIETGTDICSVALSRDNMMVALRENNGEQDHARKLSVYIDEILKENDLDPADLDAVAVAAGPGSYTGLRIGASTAKGLCYALGIPLIAVGSLDSLVNVALEDQKAGILPGVDWDNAVLCPMIDARRMEVYARIYDRNLTPSSDVEAVVVTSESFSQFRNKGSEFVIFGNGARKCLGILTGVKYADVTPSARGLVKPAHEAFRDGRFEDIAYFEPFYLKDFIVLESKKKLF